MTDETVVLVPGLRGHVEDHWQTRLAARLPSAWMVPPLGRTEPSLQIRLRLLDHIVEDVDGPVVIVAHSAGVLATVHWAATYTGTKVVGALLATPPAFAAPLPPEYPSLDELRDHGWLPIPRRPLPFPSILATSTDDALGNPVRLRAMANAWGSREHSLGAVGHLNPASGFGEWPGATSLIEELRAGIRSELVPA
jgi:uncharacterized protein